MSSDYPRLRYLDVFPHVQDGRTLLVLRDPTQISETMLIVAPEILQLFPLLNGEHSLRDIQAQATRSEGRLVTLEEIQGLLKYLDEALFLDNDRFRNHYGTLVEEFRAMRVRAPKHAGAAYPSDPVELAETLARYYTDERGAGLPQQMASKPVVALAAPHIDLRSGGPTYTHAYRRLAESPAPDLFVILGTGHMGLPNLFSISPKTFETPLGSSQSDRDFVGLLQRHLGDLFFSEDFSHRQEHTIEFQLVFLHHMYRSASIPLVPILCSFSYGDVDGTRPDRLALFERFIEAFGRSEEESQKRVCIIASIDLAHIGPRYGDDFVPDKQLIDSTMKADRQMLEFVCGGEAEGFLGSIAAEEDRRRICGFPALYSLLRIKPGLRGRLLSHNYTTMDQTGSFVSYASLVFEEREDDEELL